LQSDRQLAVNLRAFFPVIMVRRISNRFRELHFQMRSAIWSLRWSRKQKPLSALIRVRDGEEFLTPSTESIVDLVDEVVIVDNYSRDRTPLLSEQLASRYPDKIRCCRYNHDVVTVGEDSAVLYREDPKSPRLAHNYSNWCMARCKHPFVLKWDDDMIACPNLAREIERFKTGRNLQFDFGGHNISPDFQDVLKWKAGIEPRIFPLSTRFQMVDFGNIVKSKPGVYFGEAPMPWVISKYRLVSDNELYAHLKYCKRNPGSNQSSGFRKNLEMGIDTGDKIPEHMRQALQQYLPQAKL
jgi:glycosyltransferase involved in cell wall biosynthesis